jgi:TonB family protein
VGEAKGSLDKEQIREVIRSHRAEIQRCFEKALEVSPSLEGKVVVKFVIGVAGPVMSAKVAESTVGNEAMDTCVTDAVRTWTFPRPKGDGVVVVTYPFLFRPAKQGADPGPETE